MGTDCAKEGDRAMKIFIGVALGVVCALEIAFAIWDYNESRRGRR